MSSNKEFIKKNKVIIVDDDKNTRLHYACALNKLEIVKEEIKSGHKIDPENYLGWTPLMMAIRNGHVNIVKYLIEERADATKKNQFGISIFLLSVTSGNLDLCKAILEHLLCGGISRLSMERHLSPISLAIMFGQPHILKYLIERRFDLNSATPTTMITPLMFAAAMGNNKAIKKLVNMRVDVKLKNYLGFTAPEISEQKRDSVVTIGLKKKQKKTKPQTPLVIVSQNESNPTDVQTFGPKVENDKNLSCSSNLTPFYCSPIITPITPQIMQQMFFPQDFSPNYYSPIYSPNDLLNARTVHPPYFSPIPQQQPVVFANYSS